MTAADLPVYAYFQLEDYGWDEICDLPGANKECMADWDYEARTVFEVY